MLLSIIIPYYNRNHSIGRMLDSLLDQDISPSDYEIIVVDDGSQEEPVVLKDYANRYSQIHYHRIDHTGVSPARNLGISLATGKWLYFCDSDDFLQRKVLKGIIEAAEERQLEMISARVTRIKPDYRNLPSERNFAKVSETLRGWEYIGISDTDFMWGTYSYLVHRSIVETNKLLFKDIYYVEDRVFLLQLASCVSRYASIDVDLYYYVQNDDSIMHSMFKRDRTELPNYIRVYFIELKSVLDNPSIPDKTLDYLKKRDWVKYAYQLLSNDFKWRSVRDAKADIAFLESLGAYPIMKADDRVIDRRRKLVNHKHLWILLCRIYHLVPEKVRMKY